MDRKVAERNLVIVLFIFVIILFSFADRDSKKLEQLYTDASSPAKNIIAAESLQPGNHQ